MTTRVTAEQLREHVTCWDEFVTQVTDAALRTYGPEYNNWALYIPALMAELNNSVARCVHDRYYTSDQMDLPLDDTNDESRPADEQTELSVHARLDQLNHTRLKPGEQRVMDPFRRLAQQQAMGADESMVEPVDDLWESDPDWNE